MKAKLKIEYRKKNGGRKKNMGKDGRRWQKVNPEKFQNNKK
jgi:hypothetical protein